MSDEGMKRYAWMDLIAERDAALAEVKRLREAVERYIEAWDDPACGAVERGLLRNELRAALQPTTPGTENANVGD